MNVLSEVNTESSLNGISFKTLNKTINTHYIKSEFFYGLIPNKEAHDNICFLILILIFKYNIMEQLGKLRSLLKIELDNFIKKGISPSYKASGELIANSLTKNYWEFINIKEKLEFTLKYIDGFIQSEIDTIEKVQYDCFDND